MGITILDKKNKKETDEIINFLEILTVDEIKEFNSFIQGIKFCKALNCDRA